MMSHYTRLSLFLLLAAAALLWVWLAVLPPPPVHGAATGLEEPRVSQASPAGRLPSLEYTPAVTVYLPLLQTTRPFRYSDEFDDPASGWYTGADDTWSIGYAWGEYQILLTTGDYNSAWGTPGLALPADYRLEVDARLASANMGSYGLVFGVGWSDGSVDGLYQFMIFPADQEYIIEEWSATDDWTTPVPQTYSPVINPGQASNHLRVDRIGSSIHAYINGVLVATCEDSSLAGPGLDAGLRAYAYDQVPVDVRFDNFAASIATLPDPLYYESFDVAGRWYTGDDGWSTWSYQGSEYEILMRSANTWTGVPTPLGGGLPRSSIEADMRFATATLGGYGLIFGLIDWDRFYVYIVYPGSQKYGLWLHTTSGWTTLIPSTFSPVINAGTAANHLRVDRDLGQITLYANGGLLATLYDSTYPGNLATGFYAQTGSGTPLAARFDNFGFRELPPTGVMDGRPGQPAVSPAALRPETDRGAGPTFDK